MSTTTSAIIDRIAGLLERTQPFDRLTEAQRRDLLSDISIEYYNEGDVVLQQGSTQHPGLYIVEAGLVRLMDVAQQRLLDKCGEGDVFGSFGLLKGGSLIYEAKAVEPTVCAVLKVARFQQLYDQNEEFASFFNQDLKQYLSRMGAPRDVAGAHLLMTRRLYQLVHREPVTCAPDLPAQQAARLMKREGVGSLMVMHQGRLAGILTDRDLRNKLLAAGKPLDTPVRRLMSAPVYTINDESKVLDAMLTMMRRRVYRLVITTRKGKTEVPVGLLTDRDVSHFRGQDPIATLRRVSHAHAVAELARIRTQANEQLLYLYRQGVQPETLNVIISELYDRLVVRVLELSERDLKAEAGEDRVELPWAWLRLGNGGRQETALASEKYGALVYANPASAQDAQRAQRWFGRLFDEANAALEVCGFQTSDEAAPDLQRCHTLRDWKKIYRTWIFEAEDLTPVPPFFDLRWVYGDQKLFEALRLDVEDALNVQAMDAERSFLSLMAAQALENRPPLSFFRRFVLERSGEERPSFNIRDRGVRPIVDAARLLALELRYVASSSTFERLRHAAEALPEMAEAVGSALEAYQLLVDVRLAHQLQAVESNEPPNNQIDPTTLTKVQRNLLKTAFDAVSNLQEAVAKRYNVKPRRFLGRET